MNALRSYRLENGYAIFADSKQRLRPLSFLSRTVNVLYFSLCGTFAFLSFHLRTASRSLAHHHRCFFSSLAYSILESIFSYLPTQISILASQICLFLQSLQCVQVVIQVSCSLPSQFFEARCIHGVAAIVAWSVVYEGY